MVPNAGSNGYRMPTASVSDDGTTIVFRSQVRQTGYDNHGIPEFYRYSTAAGLTCVTCNPTGSAPSTADFSGPLIQRIGKPGPAGPNNTGTALPRNLSADGTRFFFQTDEKLVAADINGDDGCPPSGAYSDPSCQDVYEWEAPGSGSCAEQSSAYSPQDKGCIYLLSSGKSSSPSFFANASASGDDVFIFTREQLVPQDQDALQDVYDVRAGGGLASQHPSSPVPCEGDACRGAGSVADQHPSSGSGSFTGPGNPPAPRPCPKGKVRRGKRCVPRHHHKPKPRKHNHHRRTHR
jgi:hypothetical protein